MGNETTINRLSTAIRTKRGWVTAAKAVFLLGIGFLLAWVILPGGDRPLAPTGHPADHRTDVNGMWTCSMHPQIQQPRPGKCPICAMDLIPVGGGPAMVDLRQIEISPAARQLMNIQVRPVERRYVTTQVRMVGKVEFDETRLRRIAARIPGRIDRLYVDYTGIEVRQGDHLVHLYSPELYSAQQELIQALRSQRQRDEQPTRRTLPGIDLVDSAREKMRLLGVTDEQIREIEDQEQPTSHLTIYAPIGGVVIEKQKQEGDYIQTGDQIYTLADLSQVWVQLDAYESDLIWLRYGQEVSFTTEAYPAEKFTGRIAFISPVLDDRTRTVTIRVNVANPELKLKPNMFVRGIAEAEIASGGRVIDADLAGKWISPMHPEIVKDQPGDCDICGMPLVRAETLGYVSTEDLLTEPPLVIPASAVLWTGTRAIVYVEVPDTDQPTFEGREIVLGPRAGDFYLVRNGLAAGEHVVTQGNFKIDSALQIQARPSMMTPEGGGGGGHQHDHGGPASPGEASPQPVVGHAPPEFYAQLEEVETAFQVVEQAVAASQLQEARQGFQRFDEALSKVDAELAHGQPATLWKELRMLLSNHAAIGMDAVDMQKVQAVAEQAGRTMDRLHEQIIQPHLAHAEHAEHEGKVAQRLEVPPQFSQQLATLLRHYFALQTALAGDDLASAKQAIDEFLSATEQVSEQELPPKVSEAWQRERNNLQLILRKMADQTEIQEVRLTFSQLSGEVEAIVHRFGAGPAGPIYRIHCPMAFGNQGAWWLQSSDEEVRNPYYGARMLKCHDRLEKIASRSHDLTAESVNE